MNPPVMALCRVCCEPCPQQLVPFVGDDHSQLLLPCPLPEAIATVGDVRVETGDGLPQQCCVRCLQQVTSAYALKRLCQQSDRKLREMFPVTEDPLVEVKQEKEEIETLFEEGETPCEDAEEKFPQLQLVKEEIEIDDRGDRFFDEDSNSMEFEETADDVSGEDVCYEKVPVEGFRCCGCKHDFESKDDLLAHRDAVHISRKLTSEQLENRVQCDICYKVVKHPRMLVGHRQRICFDFRCKTCGEKYVNRIRVINHFRINHALNVGGACICCGCEQKFNSKEELAAHSEAVHLPKRPPPDANRTVECDVCYASYKHERGLLVHKTRFTKAGQKHQCSECGKYFRYSHGWKLHLKTHVRTRCHLCPVVESSNKALVEHLAAHMTPDKRYKCLVCGESYRAPQGLRHHGMDHTGERPHTCPQCPATFTKTTQLTRHMKAHRNQRDHQCKLCSAKFVDPSNLNQHVRFYHRKEKPMLCFFCDHSFAKGYDRRRHMENKHAAELQANPELEVEMRGRKRGRGCKLGV